MVTEALRSHPDQAEWSVNAKSLQGAAPATRAIDGLSFLTGLYLAISPWVVGFERFTTLTANNLIVGAALAMLALRFVHPYGSTRHMAWAAPVIGAWTIIAPWVVNGHVATTATIWSNVVTGVVAVLLGLAATALGMRRSR
jgi:VIT1/CCC1 family predicted Fe2+/Mn2+ transporter